MTERRGDVSAARCGLIWHKQTLRAKWPSDPVELKQMANYSKQWLLLIGIWPIVLGGFPALANALERAQGGASRALQTDTEPRVQVAGIFDFLLGNPRPSQTAPAPEAQPPQQTAPAPENAPQKTPQQRPSAPQASRTPGFGGGSYRTLCVRVCDGYYFPISYQVTRSRFEADAAACSQRCSGDARLFVHRNPGQDVAGAIDLQGNRYANLANAFRYRKELVQGCSCQSSASIEAASGSLDTRIWEQMRRDAK